MEWVVQVDGNQLTLTPEQLLNQLLAKVTQIHDRPDQEALVKMLAERLSFGGALSSMSLEHIMAVALTTGYFYRIFREKNDVEILEEGGPDAATDSNKDTDQPTGSETTA